MKFKTGSRHVSCDQGFLIKKTGEKNLFGLSLSDKIYINICVYIYVKICLPVLCY
jgi:hypothetical protein